MLKTHKSVRVPNKYDVSQVKLFNQSFFCLKNTIFLKKENQKKAITVPTLELTSQSQKFLPQWYFLI